jgi:hypothetical protein
MNIDNTKFNELASRINSHVASIKGEGAKNPRDIFNKMMAYLPELHVLWTDTTDEELGQLFSRYPDFQHYCTIVEEMSIEEQAKDHREYDGLDKFSEKQQEAMKSLLTNSVLIEKALLDFKVGKQGFHKVAYDELCDDVSKWNSEAEVFIKQLKTVGFHEYGVKTCERVIAETFKKLTSLINDTKDRF